MPESNLYVSSQSNLKQRSVVKSQFDNRKTFNSQCLYNAPVQRQRANAVRCNRWLGHLETASTSQIPAHSRIQSIVVRNARHDRLQRLFTYGYLTRVILSEVVELRQRKEFVSHVTAERTFENEPSAGLRNKRPAWIESLALIRNDPTTEEW